MRYFGVTVHIIEPGFFKTNITDAKRIDQHIETLWEKLDTDTKESYGIEYFEKGKNRCLDLCLFIANRWSLWTLLA